MAKKAIVILAPGFEEIEAVTVIDILRRAEVDVTVAGVSDRTVRASRLTTIVADITLEEAETYYDALILPGGMPGASNLAASEKVIALIKHINGYGHIIAAICASPAIVLAPTGILNGKQATCYPGMQDKFDDSTIYSEEPVVSDGNIITSRGPATALPFALKIVAHLVDRETSEKVRKALLAGI